MKRKMAQKPSDRTPESDGTHQKHAAEQADAQPTRRTKNASENFDEVSKAALEGKAAVDDPSVHPSTMPSANRLLPVKQVASMLGISVRFVWRLVARGDLKRPVRLGRSRKWVYLDVLAYIEQLKDDRDRRTG